MNDQEQQNEEASDIWEVYDNGQYLIIQMFTITEQGKILIHQSKMNKKSAQKRGGNMMAIANTRLNKNLSTKLRPDELITE